MLKQAPFCWVFIFSLSQYLFLCAEFGASSPQCSWCEFDVCVCACVFCRIALLYLLMVCWLAGTVFCTLIYLIHLFGDWTIYPPDDRRTSCCCSCTHLACAWHFLAKFFYGSQKLMQQKQQQQQQQKSWSFILQHRTADTSASISDLFVCVLFFSFSFGFGHCQTDERERETEGDADRADVEEMLKRCKEEKRRKRVITIWVIVGRNERGGGDR